MLNCYCYQLEAYVGETWELVPGGRYFFDRRRYRRVLELLSPTEGQRLRRISEWEALGWQYDFFYHPLKDTLMRSNRC